MRPYYYDEQAGIFIYLGDCRELMQGWTIPPCELLLTDPPYGIGLETRYESKGKRSILAQNRDYPLVVGDDQPFDPSHLLGYSKAVLWGANYYANKLPASRQWFVWDKRDGVLENDGSDCELAWTKGTKGIATRTFRHLWNGMLKDSERGERRWHPTQKPIALMSWCLSFFPKAKRVIDPYMGSGTTLVAAKLAGMSAVGIEVSEEYCERAVKRLAQGVLFAGKESA
jgi:site-specific DNA-methyltransferase (adenine-specific)